MIRSVSLGSDLGPDAARRLADGYVKLLEMYSYLHTEEDFEMLIRPGRSRTAISSYGSINDLKISSQDSSAEQSDLNVHVRIAVCH